MNHNECEVDIKVVNSEPGAMYKKILTEDILELIVVHILKRIHFEKRFLVKLHRMLTGTGQH